MRTRWSVAVLLSAAAAAATLAPGTGEALPAGAQKWLGRWETNFGVITVQSVYREKSEVPDVNGKAQYYWAVYATWTTKDGDARSIKGGLVDRNGFDTLGGCWKPSPEPTSCARIEMYRKGDRITGGYWKNCRDYCRSHHPITGRLTRPMVLLGFRFHQHGKPEGHTAIVTQSGGAGSLQSEDRQFTGDNRALDGSGAFHFDVIAGDAENRIDVRIMRGRVSMSSDYDIVALDGVVSTSANPRCEVGASFVITIRESHGAAPDRIFFKGKHLDPDRPHCQLAEEWISTDPRRVSVHIDAPRDSGR